jgi:hypothetical protein
MKGGGGCDLDLLISESSMIDFLTTLVLTQLY